MSELFTSQVVIVLAFSVGVILTLALGKIQRLRLAEVRPPDRPPAMTAAEYLPPPDLVVKDGSQDVHVFVSPTSIEVGLEGCSFIEIATPAQDAAEDILLRSEEVALTSDVSRQLGGMLREVPNLSLLNAAYGVSKTSVEIIVKPELAKAMNDGSATFMRSKEVAGAFRGPIVDGSNKVVGQASFRVDDAAKVASIATCLWQVAAIATSQKYLADIDRRLAGIEKGLGDVKGWLYDKETAKIASNAYWMKQHLDSLKALSLDAGDWVVIKSQLETIERESVEATLFFCDQAAKLNVELQKPFFDNRHKLDENRTALTEQMDHLAKCYAAATAALFVRGMANQARLVLSGSTHLQEPRIDGITSHKEKVDAEAERALAALHTRIETIEHWWGWFWEKGKATELKAQMQFTHQELRKEIGSKQDRMREAVSGWQRLLEEKGQNDGRPLVLLADLDAQGSVVRLHRTL